jgi:hypothetical protein
VLKLLDSHYWASFGEAVCDRGGKRLTTWAEEQALAGERAVWLST